MGCSSSRSKVAVDAPEQRPDNIRNSVTYVALPPLIPLSEGSHEDYSASVDASSPLRQQYSAKSLVSGISAKQHSINNFSPTTGTSNRHSPAQILHKTNDRSDTPPTISPQPLETKEKIEEQIDEKDTEKVVPRFAPPSLKDNKTMSFGTLSVNGDAEQNSLSVSKKHSAPPPVGLGSRPPSIRMKDKTMSFGNLSVSGDKDDNTFSQGSSSKKPRPSWTEKIMGVGTPIIRSSKKYLVFGEDNSSKQNTFTVNRSSSNSSSSNANKNNNNNTSTSNGSVIRGKSPITVIDLSTANTNNNTSSSTNPNATNSNTNPNIISHTAVTSTDSSSTSTSVNNNGPPGPPSGPPPPLSMNTRAPSMRLKDKTMSFGNLSVNGDKDDNTFSQGNSIKKPRPSWTEKIMGIGTPIMRSSRKKLSPSNHANSSGSINLNGSAKTDRNSTSLSGSISVSRPNPNAIDE